MSSIDSLKLTIPITGQTTYISPVTDLFRFNSLAYSAFYSHASLEICNLQLYFSTDNETYTLYKEITLNNNITSTGNELIPARFFKFEIENPDLNSMSLINVLFTVHKTATSNIDVNTHISDIVTVVGNFSTEVTQNQVKSILESKGFNLPVRLEEQLNNTPVDKTTTAPSIFLGSQADRYNSIQVIGSSDDATYRFCLEYSTDGIVYFTDGITNDMSVIADAQNVNTFSVSRTKISVPYIRVKHLNTTQMSVTMKIALSRE